MEKAWVREEILGRGHWVFDLDGTLTVAIHDFVAIRELLGVPRGGDILGHLDGLAPEESLVLREKLVAIEEELADRTEPARGAQSLVGGLCARGARMGILTRNTKAIALRTLERIGLAGYFDPGDVLGREEARAKPDPDGIFKLARRWGMAPQALVMVGDYAFDLQTGRAAGAATVHVDPTGAFRWPEITDIAVESLAELAQALPGPALTPGFPAPAR